VLEPLEARHLLATSWLSRAAAPIINPFDDSYHTFSATPGRLDRSLLCNSEPDDDDEVIDEGPTITQFQAIQMDENNWMLQGQVIETEVEGLVVTIGGDLPPLQSGKTTSVESNGWFYLQITLGASDSGTVTAQTTDRAGQPSNVAQAIVR
jgi:hypothetical protein